MHKFVWRVRSGKIKIPYLHHVIKRIHTSTNLRDSFDLVAVVEISAPTNVLEYRRLFRVCLNVRTPGNRRSCPVAFQFTVYIVKEDVTTGLLSFKKGWYVHFIG